MCRGVGEVVARLFVVKPEVFGAADEFHGFAHCLRLGEVDWLRERVDESLIAGK